MNILIVSLWSILNDSIGGTEKFVVDLAHLLSKDYNVTILSLGETDLDTDNVRTVSLHIVPDLNEYSLQQYLDNGGFSEISAKLTSFIKENSFDIVHANSLLFANLIHGVPVVQTVHTNLDEFAASFPTTIAATILDNVAQDSNVQYVTPSEFSQESFYNLTKKESTVINHSHRSDITLSDKTSLRLKYQIPENDLVFCVPSRLEIEQKGQAILLGALRRVKQRLPSFTVVLGGCDTQYIKNKELLLKMYPDLSLVIEGFADKSDMYSLADIIVLPSRTESFGYATLESAILGFPLFISNIPPYKEIARGNPYIILFENDEAHLADAMLKNIEIIIRHKLTSPPPRWSNRYLDNTMLKKYLTIYNDCIKNHKNIV